MPPFDPQSWPVPSARSQELIRQAALAVLNEEVTTFLADVAAAGLSGENMRAIAADPVLAEGSRRSTIASLRHWATANVRQPGARVEPLLAPEMLSSARDLVRRGLDKDALTLESYRTVQAVAWRQWMSICLDLTNDPAAVREALDMSALSISTYVDDTITMIAARMDEERDELTLDTHAVRHATLALILEGAAIDRGRAEQQLGYAFNGRHTAMVLWGRPATDAGDLDGMAQAIMRASDAERRLTIPAGTDALWLWIPRDASADSALRPVIQRHPGVRIAVGRSGSGLDGFCSSHRDAVTTQRMLDSMTPARRLAGYRDIQLVALAGQNATATDEFVRDTLGPMATAGPDLREILLTYIRARCNATATAERLYTHRNTVLRRLVRCEELLPRPLDECLIEVGVALELLAWQD